jgi:hypothetical protein
MNPDKTEYYSDLSIAYRRMGQPRQAAIALLEGLAVDTTKTAFASGLVDLYKEIDPQGCAVGTLAGGTSLNIECPLVHSDVCTASRNVVELYRRVGKTAEADRIQAGAIRDLACPAAPFNAIPR